MDFPNTSPRFHLQFPKSFFDIPVSQMVKSQAKNKNDGKQLGHQVHEHAKLFSQSHGFTFVPPVPSRDYQKQVSVSNSIAGERCIPHLPTDGFYHSLETTAVQNSGSVDHPQRESPPKRATTQNSNMMEPFIPEISFDHSVSQIVKSQKCENFRKSSVTANKFVPPAPSPLTDLGLYGQSQRSQTFRPQIMRDKSIFQPSENPEVDGVKLRSVEEIPSDYCNIFSFPYFNILQSLVLDEVLYTDKSVVASAPTGSGKTVLFELAIIRLLMKTGIAGQLGKIIYMAPMKALCTERFQDWSSKLGPHNLNCLEVTGDTEMDDLGELLNAHLVCTTPEKWDSMSRRWKDNKTLFQQIQLFLIDEIHTLNDPNRGATVEAVVSRMKTLQTAHLSDDGGHLRFVAVSATMPNYNDIAEWLGSPSKPAAAFSLGEKHRPVKLNKVVIGYPFKEGTSDFCFDMNLSYRLRSIIQTHSHGKPTLVFCSSRKSVVQSAETLAKDMRTRSLLMHFSPQILQRAAGTVHEHKLSELLQLGIGMHHAGLDPIDRHTVEDLFKSSQLPVLISTSTLAMGVNLPAHLVIIKSTHFYNMGMVQEYSDMQILQMIGRAGRPQTKYESLITGTQLIESSLHKNLIEHLNAEIVLQTISEMTMAVEWIRHTFLYIRVLKNPRYYGLPSDLNRAEVEKKLKDLCLQSVNQLKNLSLVSINEETSSILPTGTGRLMARYCIAFKTMERFHGIGDKEQSIADMLTMLCKCSEFDDIQLRTNEKRILNSLNKDKNKETIRFPLPGKIKTTLMKVNCLIQAQLSCLPIQDFSLSQDTAKIFRVGQRVTKCLMEFMYQGTSYSQLLHSILIYKAFKSKLWYDSRYVARQLDGIGPTMSLALANSGMSSFQKLEQANPRDIELIVNRHPPFGNLVIEAVSALPKYELAVEQMKCYKPSKAVLVLSVDLLNRPELESKPSNSNTHQSILIVGDAEDQLIFKWRVSDASVLREGTLIRTVEVKRSSQDIKLNISLLSQDWVGLDIQMEYEPVYTEGWFDPVKISSDSKVQTPSSKLRAAIEQAKNLPCNLPSCPGECSHKCLDKANCGHKCCKSNSVKRTSSLVSGSTNTKKPRKETSLKEESKCMKEMYHILQQHHVGFNQSRISMKKGEQFPQPHETPVSVSAVVDDCRPSSNIWDQEQFYDDSDDFENDRAEQNVLENDHGLHQYLNETFCQNTAITEADLCKDHGKVNSEDDCMSDVIILDDVPLKDTVRNMKLTTEKGPTQCNTSNINRTLTHGKNSSRCETGGNKLPDVTTIKARQRPDKAESSSLDVTANGWADLDAYHTSRQVLYRNGRPLHLQDEAWSDDELLSSTSAPQPGQNIDFIKEGREAPWATTTSSDEELCQLVDSSTVPPGCETKHSSSLVSNDKKMHESIPYYSVHNFATVDPPKGGNNTYSDGMNDSALPHTHHKWNWARCDRAHHGNGGHSMSQDLFKESRNTYPFSDDSSNCIGLHSKRSPSVVSVDDLNSVMSDDCYRQQPTCQDFSQASPGVYSEKLSQTVPPTLKAVAAPCRHFSDIDSLASKSKSEGSNNASVSCTEHGNVVSQGSSNRQVHQSHHRYGHVKAWKKDTEASAKSLNSSGRNGNSRSSVSKFFVPKTKVSSPEAQSTGGLFEGIF